jgi:hypothetical protein
MKKISLLLVATVVLISCSKVGKGEYLITGVAKGIENGKTLILETQSPIGGGLIAIDTVKVENEKFEIKGKVTEPSFHLLQLESIPGKEPYGKIVFILEEGEISIEVNKDSIQKTKVSGTYNNDEYFKFNEDLIKINKSLADFQKINTKVMSTAQQTNDTAVINKLMKEYSKIQEVVGAESKNKYSSYAETHPKSFITALILQGMLGDPSVDVKKVETLYNGLEESIKKTKPGIAIKDRLKEMKNPSVAPTPNAPAAADGK